MARQETLLRIHQQLIAQRDALRKTVAEDLHGAEIHDEGVGDEGDAAMDGAQSEINSQLAALESRELSQIEAAIQQIRDGNYGICSSCSEKITLERLKALPFTTSCIRCQRLEEDQNQGHDEDSNADWASAFQYDRTPRDKEITISDLEMDLQ